MWRYTLDPPGPGWHMEHFADTLWESGPAGFGHRGMHRNFKDRSPWDTTGIWLRREFHLNSLPGGQVHLNVISFNTVSTVFVNGQKLAVFRPTDNQYEMTDFTADLSQLLRTGSNTIAVHGYSKNAPADPRSGKKMQFVDAGIIEVLGRER